MIMKVKVLGGHGGVTIGFQATSFLIDDELLIDAGSVASTLSIDRQSHIKHILISHSHLDHIKDLAFLCDNCFGLRPQPFDVWTHPTVIKIIRQHLFNDTVWPDFSVLPNAKNPTIRFNEILPETSQQIGSYRVTGIPVQHPNDAMGFIVEREGKALLFTCDTGPTERIWQVAKNYPHLKAIFTEVSFPNRMAKVAQLSDHHTPESLGVELAKMPPGINVILTHMKPNYKGELEQEIAELHDPRLQMLMRDGAEFQF
jgi:cAMP phosphodiesterase